MAGEINMGGRVRVLVDKDTLDWLEWFHEHADFGPADDDVRFLMIQQYEAETGNRGPQRG